VLKAQSATIPIIKEDGSQEQAFLFRLGGLLESAEKVKQVTELAELPRVVNGESEMGMAKFCVVDLKAKGKIED
jgi:hypothetical protein